MSPFRIFLNIPTTSLYLLIYLSLGSLVQSVNAGEIKFSEAFNVLTANGKEYGNSFSTGDRVIPVNEGVNRFILQYDVLIDGDDDDEFDVIKSSPFLLEVYLNKNADYRQNYLKPATVEAAKKYSKNPLMKIVSNNGKEVAHQWRFVENTDDAFLIQLTKSGIRKPNAPLDLSRADNASGQSKSTGVPSALSMLEYWWNKASKEEKQSFLKNHSNKPPKKD